MMIKNNRGFTLIELMIATTIFSIIMLLSTYVFLAINNYYTKGVNNARVQDAIRNVVSDIGGQLQLTPTNFSIGSNSYCVGNNLYVFNTNGAYEDGNGTALYKIDTDSACNPSGTSKKVLLPRNSRITEFKITPLVTGTSNKLYTIEIGVIVAPVDNNNLLPDPQTDLIISNIGNLSNKSTWRCAVGAGSQYCAYNSISTTVFRRL